MEGAHVAHDAIIEKQRLHRKRQHHQMAGEIIIDDEHAIIGAVMTTQFCRCRQFNHNNRYRGGSFQQGDVPHIL